MHDLPHFSEPPEAAPATEIEQTASIVFVFETLEAALALRLKGSTKWPAIQKSLRELRKRCCREALR